LEHKYSENDISCTFRKLKIYVLYIFKFIYALFSKTATRLDYTALNVKTTVE